MQQTRFSNCVPAMRNGIKLEISGEFSSAIVICQQMTIADDNSHDISSPLLVKDITKFAQNQLQPFLDF